MSATSRCDVEAELRLKARWNPKEVMASRVRSARRGGSADAIAELALGAVLAGRESAGAGAGEGIGGLELSEAERLEVTRRIEACLATDPVRREEARARLNAMQVLAGLRERAAGHGVTWQSLRLRTTARCYEPGVSNGRSWGRWLSRRSGAGMPLHPPHISLRIGLKLIGERREVERALERDRVALEEMGELAWCAPVFEERRGRRRDHQSNSAPGAAPLPAVGGRLISLLRECACCLLAEDEGASFTVARALAIFAQSQPDVTRLLMRDPRGVRLDDGIAADDPADVDFELQKSLRMLQHRHDFAGLRDFFCEEVPRLGLLRLIEHRIRTEAEAETEAGAGGSPFHAAACAGGFGEA